MTLTTHLASTDAAARPQGLAPTSRRAVFAILAAFILLGPAPGHLFGVHTMLLREWVMFSGAGVGLLKGSFTLHRPDVAVTLSPLEVAALPSYLALPIHQRVYAAADLRIFAARICGVTRETARLSFDGSVGTFAGWQALAVHDVCNEPEQGRYGARP